MGEHRANVKIDMSFHGAEGKCDMWINYCPADGDCGPDQRVIDFFEAVYDEGMGNYNKMMHELYEERNKKSIEADDLAELKRLKEKYEKE